MTNAERESLIRFMENDVKEAIPNIVQQIMAKNGQPDEELDAMLNSCKLRKTEADDIISYKFLSDPYVEVRIAETSLIGIYEKSGKTLTRDRTDKYNDIARFWNMIVTSYLEIDLPEMKLIN